MGDSSKELREWARRHYDGTEPNSLLHPVAKKHWEVMLSVQKYYGMTVEETKELTVAEHIGYLNSIDGEW